MNKDLLSDCCNSKLLTDCSDEGTCCYICGQCGKPCSPNYYMEKQYDGDKILVNGIPEIQKVMSILDKEIQRLDENVGALTERLSEVLISERPKDVGNDRPERECKLAEDIQKDVDIIGRINDLIDELRYRIAV